MLPFDRPDFQVIRLVEIPLYFSIAIATDPLGIDIDIY